jgi:hypothetical protein
MKVSANSATQLIIFYIFGLSEAFAPWYRYHVRVDISASATNDGKTDFFGGVKEFFQELDNFLDDATARRLGNGAAFYGKRKSNFYGKNDKNRKSDPSRPDPLEDFQAPLNGGYFQWMPDENGDLRPVTRMKKKVVERNPSFWDKLYEKDAK